MILPGGRAVPLYSTIRGSEKNTSMRQFIFFFDSEYDPSYQAVDVEKTPNSLPVLAAGIAHEMNNVFTSLLCDLSLVKELASRESDLQISCYDRAERAIQQGKDVASRLLTYADGGYPLITTISLQDLMIEVLSLHHQNDARITLRISNDLELLNVDPDLMRTALRAIVMNAVEASPDRPIEIIAANSGACSDGDLEKGSFVSIEVRDGGPGIRIQEDSKVFDPFFTTKEGHLGLGLTSARSIIERHGGSISLSSSLKDGTCVKILLPSSSDPSSVAGSGTKSQKGVSSGVRILVMDDEPGIREVLQLILKREGFHVDVVGNGDEAIVAVAQAYEELNPYQVVVLDLIVPGGMGGKEAIQRIRKISPSVLSIVSSGYSDDPISSRFRDYGFDASLPKPYHPKDMILLLFSLLDEHYCSKKSQ